ncbi:hypothetical protein ACFL31_00315 [Candidatus Margulisiibacteriota bacterium]
MARLIYIFVVLFVLQLPSFCQEIPIPFVQVPGQPYFSSPQIMIDSAEYNTLVIGIKSDKADAGRLFWSTSYNPQFNQPKSIRFSLKSGQHNYYFNLPSQSPHWVGWINGLLIYPEKDGQNAEISQAKLVNGNLYTNFKSGWQEFWGPYGRKIRGNTINVLFSNRFLGHSINTYAYWLLLFYLLYLLVRKFGLGWEKIGQKVVLLAIILWAILELSSFYTYWTISGSDWRSYFGKTPQAKAAESIGANLYNFVENCNKSLPKEGVDVGLLMPDNLEALNLQARYYLFPNRLPEDFRPKDDTPYILVYRAKDNSYAKNPKYKLLAKFKDDEYILVKK